MTTEIKWTFIVYRDHAPIMSGALSTIDLSFPAMILERIGTEHAPCTMKVTNSVGEIYEKGWE